MVTTSIGSFGPAGVGATDVVFEVAELSVETLTSSFLSAELLLQANRIPAKLIARIDLKICFIFLFLIVGLLLFGNI
jgi:hypothetical protein